MFRSNPCSRPTATRWLAMAGLTLCLGLVGRAAIAQHDPATGQRHLQSASTDGQATRARSTTTARAAGRNALPVNPTENILLSLGEVRTMPLKGKVRRIAVGSGTNVSATTVDANLLLIGEQIGVTTMMIWTDREIHAFRVRVVSPELSSAKLMLQRALEGSSGLKVDEIEGRLVVSGFATRATTERLTAMFKDTPQVVFDLRHNDTDGQLTRSVLFRLHFVEVNKSLLENIGIRWNKDMQGPTLAAQGITGATGIYRGQPASGGNNLLSPVPGFISRNGKEHGVFFGLASAITSRINLGVSKGDARILASPELTAKSGGKARLQVGGEIPIPLAGAFGAQSVEFKPYGIIFNIEPHIDGNGVILARLSTELSQIDPAVTVNGIPGFLTRSTATEISVRPGEMIALSGLINNELSNAIDRVPALGQVPILGRLFRSDDYRHSKTDLVILLEPEIISPGDGLAQQLKDRGVRNTREFHEQAAPRPAAPPRDRYSDSANPSQGQ